MFRRAYAVFLCACAGAPATPAASAARAEEADLPDPCDQCILGEETAGAGADGCPDDFHPGDACILSPAEQGKIQRAAKQLSASGRITSVRIVSGTPACALAVRSALAAAGTTPSRLETVTRGTGSDVALEVAAWEGRRCAPGP
jgi:hypothetical protein